MANFRKVGERMLPHEVLHVKINPSMDIAALALATSDIAINRLFTWQRVWSIAKPKFVQQDDSSRSLAVVDMVWSPDGKILAVAYNQPIEKESAGQQKHSGDRSSIVLYMIETNQRSVVLNLAHDLACLCWRAKSHYEGPDEPARARAINIDDMKMPLDTLTTPYVDLFVCDEELLNYPFVSHVAAAANQNSKGTVPKSDGNHKSGTAAGKKFGSTLPPVTKFCKKDDQFLSYDKLNLLQNKTTNVLVLGTKDSHVIFYLWGYYEILNIDVGPFLPHERRLEKIWMANDLNTVQVLADDAGFFQFETRLLSCLWKEIYLVQRIRLNIDIRLAFLRDTIKEICSKWSDLIIDIESRLSKYEIVPDYVFDSDGYTKTVLRPQDFMDMLIFGTIRMNVEKFLHDSSGKNTKMFHSFEHYGNEIHQLIITRLLNGLAHILSYLDNLRGIVLNDLQYGELGLSIEVVNLFRRETVMMMEKCNKLMLGLNDLKRKMLAFTRLIFKGIHMAKVNNGDFGAQPKSTEQDQTFSKMTHQDFHLVMDFLEECSRSNGFKFDQVGCMLKSSGNGQSVNLERGKNQNPYKAYVQEKQLKRFLEVLANGKLKNKSNNLSQMSDQELFRSFFSLPVSSPDYAVKESAEDSDGNGQWFRMLFNDHWNVDTIDDELFDGWSLMDHLDRLDRIRDELFHLSRQHMNDRQTRLIEDSDKRISIKLDPTGSGETPTGRLNNQRHLFDSSSESNSSYFCFGQICPENDSAVETWSTLSLARFKKSSNQNGQVELVRFGLTSGKCFDDCRCQDGVRFQVEDFQFYNSDLLTMIVTEQHYSQQHVKTNWKQYLVQCQYSKVFETVPVSRFAFHQLPCRASIGVTKIDLSINLEKINACGHHESIQVEQEDETSSIESLFKMRLLEMVNQQGCLSVSGNRNLACCRDMARCRITTFEMDACEDDDDSEREREDDEEETEDEPELTTAADTIWT